MKQNPELNNIKDLNQTVPQRAGSDAPVWLLFGFRCESVSQIGDIF